MKNIPVRHIAIPHNELVISGRFNIRNIAEILNGKDLVHENEIYA